MSGKSIKRFYKQAAVAAGGGGFAVLLDGRSVKTPKGAALLVDSERLAQAIAEEWNGQGESVDPASMPMMQLAATALDRVGAERPAMHDNLMRYCATDLLCYRAQHPSDLVRRQQECWQPVVDWATLFFDAPLQVTEGLSPVEQPGQAAQALSSYLERLDAWRFTALAVAVAATGSLLLGLALLEGFRDAKALVEASQLDELHQQELWGADEEAKARLQDLAYDIRAAERFLALL